VERECGSASGFEIIADELVFYNNAVCVVPVSLPDPTFFRAGRIPFNARGSRRR